jgi:hypothetical protein
MSNEADELGVAVAVYSATLDPTRITAALCCEPSSSHLIGERKGPRSPPYQHNAWILEERFIEPFSVDAAITKILSRIPADVRTWSRLAACCEVQVRLALHTSKGGCIRLSTSTMDAVSARSGSVVEDIYRYDNDA